VHADFLQYNLNEWVQAAAGPCAIVGNIPYHISSPILLKVLEAISPAAHEAKAGVAGREAPSSGAKIQAIMFMTQKEFAERLCAQKNSKAYGSLSVYAQLRAKISLQYQVPKEMFTPIPKVDSTIFLAEPLPPTKSASELSAIESLTRLAFAQRRKKLSNSLASLLAHVSVGNKAVDPCPINLSLRADALTPDDFCQLNRWLHEAR
jgi:16S rRNA (adenine1518-N6/adenine1519-N6)-dimethyltransferase